MKLLRNPEVRRELLLFAALTLLFTGAGFLLSPRFALAALAFGMAFTLLALYYIRRRYRAMAALAEQIDRILHGQEQALTGHTEEGELAILSTEVQKMTVRLREQSDRLAAEKQMLTEAIQDIFHQIRTPLTSMNLTVSLLREEELSFERRLQLTRELQRQLERVQWLVETLLKLSKIDAGTAVFRTDSVAVEELLEKAAAPLRIPMELREQSLVMQTSGARFTGDLAWTTEAVSNLLKNCMEHTPVGGTVTAAARETALFTELVIADNGPGFDSAELPHLFERFYKGQSAAADSIGIGLALARSILAAQNGTITAATAPTGGAVFTVRFYKSVI